MPIEVPTFDLTADFLNVTVYEPGEPPSNILEAGRPWYVHIEWEMKGKNFELIAGTWHLHVNLESIGPGPELSLYDYIPPTAITIPSADGYYHVDFDVPASVITNAHVPHQSLLMKMVVALTFYNSNGEPDDIAGFYEGPILQFRRSDDD